MKKKTLILLISLFCSVLIFKPVAAQVSVGVTITASFAPPLLPVYVQPPCPVDGYLWCPGYWAFTDDGYFWVPGVWVLPPRYGYLWTPPYWGFEAGVYGFHPGYWGPHVGYYGGVNYGYGYWGSGFVGGRWEGTRFRYNTAVVHVNQTVIHNTYVDNTVIVHNTYVNNKRISYNGGPGGIVARPSGGEQRVMRETHLQPTAEQATHIQSARTNRAQFASVNHGQPATLSTNRPEHANRPEHVLPHTANVNSNHVNAPNGHHVNAANGNPSKTNPSQNLPKHYIPLTRPNPAPHERSVPQQPQVYSKPEHRGEYSKQEQPRPQQMPHQFSQQDHSRVQQPRPAPEPHNNQPMQQHNPEKSKQR